MPRPGEMGAVQILQQAGRGGGARHQGEAGEVSCAGFYLGRVPSGPGDKRPGDITGYAAR